MGSEHTDFTALDAAIATARADDAFDRILSLVAANLSDSSGAPHLIRQTAEALTELGRFDDAIELYTDLALYAIDIDRPLDALLAIDALRSLNAESVEGLSRTVLEIWSAGSPELRRGTTPIALPGDGAVMVEPIGEADAPLDVRIENALLACGAVLQSEREPQPASIIPLLSELSGEDLAELLPHLEREICQDAEILLARGSAVGGLWWLARGGLTVDNGDGTTRALSGPNILLGVEWLFGESSRVTVRCLGQCDLVFLEKEALTQAMNARPSLRREVQRFAARYEVHQAVSRCELFQQLPVEKHALLLSKFSAFRIPTGQTLVRQDAPSPGLFLITHGSADLIVEDGKNGRVVAQLEVGDLIGLIGLQSGELARVSAIARDGTHVLFLERADLAEALARNPEAEPVLTRLREERVALESVALAE